MVAADMGIDRDQQIWLKPAQQLDLVKTTSEQGAGLGHIFKLGHTPLDLMHPGPMELDAAAKSDSGSRKHARVFKYLFNQNLPV